jgi:hypothetical protein
MRISTQIVFEVVLLGLGALALLAGCRPVQPVASNDVTASVVSTGAGDSVNLLGSDAMLVADISSERGIGVASLALNPAALPEALLLRLHLHGLEQLTVDNGAQRLEIAVASSAPHAVTQTLTGAEGSQPLQEGDDLWAAVTLATEDGSAPVIPLQDGYFDVLLPAGLVDAGHANLEVAWVDFYR